jgi:2-hydroxy-6-oxonona-2,4-dienedioate hydrolase
MGGWVGVLTALRHPERINRLVLTTPMGYRLEPAKFPGVKLQDIGKVREANLAVLRNPTVEAVRDRLTRIVHDPACLTDEAVLIRHRIYNIPEVNAVQQKLMVSYLGGPAPRKYEYGDSDLEALRASTLLCWADHNPVPTVVGEHIASVIPECQFYCASNTGHWAQYEDFEEHNKKVITFLSSSHQRCRK